MGKLIKTVVAVVGIAALVVATGGAGLGAVFTAGFASAVLPVAFGLGLLVEVASLLTKKKPVEANPTSVQRLSKNVDPEEPRKIVFGRTIAPADIRYWETYGTDNTSYDEVICVATHEIESFQEFYLEDTKHTFDGSGNSDILGTAFRWFGREVGVTNTTLAAGAGTKWINTCSMTGLAFYVLRHVYSQEKWPKGFPTRITQVVEGAKVYDPRLDSTVTGGSGAHRIDDQDTWEYTNVINGKIGRNAVLQVLWYLIGWRINGELVAGLGVDTNAILLEEWQIAATDFETAGTEVDWKSDCVLSTGDTHEANLGILEAACNGRLLDTGGLYTFHVAVDDTANIAVAFDEDDLAGPIEWIPRKKMRDQYNLVAGTYVDPSTSSESGALYQQKSFPIVFDQTYIDDDGYTRRINNKYVSVQSVKQAQELSRIDLNQTRFQGLFRAAFNYKAMIAKNWNVVTLSFSEFGWVDKLFRIVQYDITTKGIIILSLEETNSQIYTPGTVVTPDPPNIGVGYDPREQIAVVGFDAIAVAVTGDNIATQDGITASFTVPSSAVLRTDVQYKLDADSSWTSTASLTEGETQTTIAPLNPETLYDVRARHISIASVPGAWSTDSITTADNTVYRASDGVYDGSSDTILDYKPSAPGATRQVNRGTFNVLTEYSLGDIVNEAGSSYEYINATPSTGNTPPNATYWSLLASGGTGDPGVNSITGLLSNEAVTVATLDDGTGGDYSTAGGTFHVWDGVTDVTGISPVYSLQGAATGGLSISIDSGTGVYTVTGLTNDQGQQTLRAAEGGVQIDRVYSIAKALGGVKGDDGDAGADAKGLHLAASSQTFTFDGTGAADPTLQTITFTSDPQNLSGSPVFTTDPVVTLGGAGNTRTLTVANFGVNDSVEVTVTQDGLSDFVSIVRVQDGVDGIDGEDTIIGFLTNEAAVVATLNDGTGGDYSSSGGTFTVFEGVSVVPPASVTYSIPSPNPNLSLSIVQSTGVYSITNLTADTADVVLRAVYSGVTIDKTYTISKSKTGGDGTNGTDGDDGTNGTDGTDAISLRLTADSQTFTYDGNGTASPASQTITFTAFESNLGGSYAFSTVPTVTLGGSGATRTLTDTNFGLNSAVTVTVTRDGLTDRITVVRLTDGSSGLLRDLIFIASASIPTTPSGIGPAGWTNSIPVGETVWQSVSLRRTLDDVFIEDWSTPALYQGVYKGTYSDVTTYFFGDQVTLNGTTFVRSSTSPVELVGVSPPTTPVPNADWDVVAAKGDSGDPATPFNETVNYSAGTAFNMLTLATDTYGYTSGSDATFHVTVTSSITGNGTDGINTGDWPAGITLSLTLVINGGVTIIGGGGNGGSGGSGLGGGSNGGSGKHAIEMNEDLTVVNNGALKGGSGGGGGGGVGKTAGPEPDFYGGGGGGGGWPNGNGGSAGSASEGNGTVGNPGTVGGGGSGGSGGGGVGGGGGTGGGTGSSAGSTGGTGSNGGGSGGSGGTFGNGIKQNGFTVSLSGGGTNTSTGS